MLHDVVQMVSETVLAWTAYQLGRANGERRATKRHLVWLNGIIRQAKLAELRGDDRT